MLSISPTWRWFENEILLGERVILNLKLCTFLSNFRNWIVRVLTWLIWQITNIDRVVLTFTIDRKWSIRGAGEWGSLRPIQLEFQNHFHKWIDRYHLNSIHNPYDFLFFAFFFILILIWNSTTYFMATEFIWLCDTFTWRIK